ncbi:MAG: ribonuclease HII [Anaerolineales bacterium]|jgi:ribonuclease HII
MAGLDEVGRGAWAGPLVAAAVVLPVANPGLGGALRGVRDSKLMTPKQRTQAGLEIRRVCLAWAVGWAGPEEVDEIGPLKASRLAMMRALDRLPLEVDHLLLDYLLLPDCATPQTALPHGDRLVLSIAAASVLAKVWRDEQMALLDRSFPGYAFAQHKGYGTELHRRSLKALGPCPIHRLSYHPVAEAARNAGDRICASPPRN